MRVPNVDSLLYRYHLGELMEGDKREVEERSLVDDDYRERIQETEHKLMAAYIAGHLTTDKRERFEKYFLCSEDRLEKLRLAELIYDRVKAGAAKFPEADDILYRYFLGRLTPDEKSKVEERLATDIDYETRSKDVEHEFIVAYALEKLNENERESFESHFLSSEEGAKKLRFAEAVYEYYEYDAWAKAREIAGAKWSDQLPQWLAKFVSLLIGHLNISRPIWQPLAAASVIVLFALVWALFSYQSAITRSLDILHVAYAQNRPVAGRLTGFGYAEYQARQNAEVVKFYNDERDEAFRLILREVNEEKSAAAYHALGQIHLAYNDPNEAVHRLELALQQAPDDARLHNDLAVALMERENGGGKDTALASEHLHRAIKLAPSLLDAHFNLALCHQRQTLLRAAEEDWKRYLEKDSVSRWAEEARKNLAQVTEKIKQAGGNRENIHQDFLKAYRGRDVDQAWGAYKQSRVGSGSFITNRLIDNYLSLALSGKSTDAQDNMSALLFIGNIELEKVKDRFTYDLAQFYRGAAPQQLRKLSAARGLAKAAAESMRQSRLTEAINNYRQAIDLFDDAGDVCESLAARALLGNCYFRQGSADLSLSVFTEGRRECEALGYIWPLGLFLNGLANVNMDLTKYSAALDYGLSQVSYAKQIKDDYGVLLGTDRLTTIYLLLGRYRDTLIAIQEGLSAASAINVNPGQIVALYAKASKCYMRSGMLLAALDYQKEAFKLSLETKIPWVASRYQVYLGLAYHKLNNHSEAIKLIQESGEVGRRLQDEKMSREVTAFSDLHLGEIYRETGDLDSSVKSYEDALRLLDEGDINSQWMRFEAKRGMLLTSIKRGNDAATEEYLEQVLDLYEESRNNIEDEVSRNSFFDEQQGVYDLAIEYAYFKRQNPRRAFDFSESNRARSLLDAVNLPPGKSLDEKLTGVRLPRSNRPLDLGQIQGRLPGKTQLLQYAVLDERLIVWVVSAAAFNSRSVDVSRGDLENKVSEYLQSIAGGPDASQGADYRARSVELYDLLIKPVENLLDLDKDAQVCIIPDKALNRLPFASLISSATGRHLIEDRVIFTSPSSNIFLVASDKARQKEGIQSERLLSVGNPSFDRATFGELKDLPWAAAQASEISAFYPNSIVLLGKYAREHDIRREIEKSDVIHFAAHYVTDERSPMLSMLPLAGEKNPASKASDGVLQTFEFYNLKLLRPRLVVLSACRTMGEGNFNGEGAVGLARPFQAAGIPIVISTLWAIESYSSKELMVRFHKYRKSEGLSTPQALRRAQIDLLKSASAELRNPYNWAAYTVIGGHSNY